MVICNRLYRLITKIKGRKILEKSKKSKNTVKRTYFILCLCVCIIVCC